MEPQLNQEVINTAAEHDGPIETDAVIVGAGPVGLFQVFELGLLEIKAHASAISRSRCFGSFSRQLLSSRCMVLQTRHFKLHRSLRKTLAHFQAQPGCELRFDSSFESVINACANKLRAGQPGTWIVPDMVQAYSNLHRAGHAHSVETWVNGELAGGLYCVNLGGMPYSS